MKKNELQIQAESFRWLRAKNIFCHSVPNEAAGRSKIMQTQLAGAGLVSGVADMVVWWPDGIGYLEFKTPTGKQSQHQKSFENLCRNCGVSYDLARSLEDVQRIYQEHINALYKWMNRQEK